MRKIRRRKVAAMLLAGCLLTAGCFCLTGCGQKADEAVEACAFTVNGEEISYREWNFYLRLNQMQWEKSYLESYGDDMWSREVDEEGKTLADDLKENVFETIVQTHLINQHADEYGACLSEEDKEQIRQSAGQFMGAYHEALLDYAGADEDFVYELLSEVRLSELVADASVADYEPDIQEEDYYREGICYVLISTTGLRDDEGNLEPFSEEEVARRTKVAQELCVKARESGDLKTAAESYGLTPIESSMGRTNEGDGQEHRMLDAARALAVGEISEPVQTEEGWFLVQHTTDYDEEGTEYWKEYLTALALNDECVRICEDWRENAEIQVNQEVLDRADVKIVLKELL